MHIYIYIYIKLITIKRTTPSDTDCVRGPEARQRGTSSTTCSVGTKRSWRAAPPVCTFSPRRAKSSVEGSRNSRLFWGPARENDKRRGRYHVGDLASRVETKEPVVPNRSQEPVAPNRSQAAGQALHGFPTPNKLDK